MRKQTAADKLAEAIKQHNESYEHWEHLNTYGGSDPFWSDGMNMHLAKNHICYYKNQIKELCEELKQPLSQEYYRELPPEVDMDYVARADEIRSNAKKSLEIYKRNQDYKDLFHISIRLPKKQLEDSCINNILGYVTSLENAIKEDDLITMRRHENPDNYIESFKDGLAKAKELKTKQKQMDIFDFMG